MMVHSHSFSTPYKPIQEENLSSSTAAGRSTLRIGIGFFIVTVIVQLDKTWENEQKGDYFSMMEYTFLDC